MFENLRDAICQFLVQASRFDKYGKFLQYSEKDQYHFRMFVLVRLLILQGLVHFSEFSDSVVLLGYLVLDGIVINGIVIAPLS